MLSKPKNGWSSWCVKDFIHPISYIDDMPFVLLDKIIDFFDKEECQEIEFDAEGYFYKIYLGFPVYGVAKYGDMVTIADDMVLFTNEILSDIETDIKDWSEFPTYSESETDALFIEKELEKRINDVKGAMKRWMERSM